MFNLHGGTPAASGQLQSGQPACRSGFGTWWPRAADWLVRWAARMNESADEYVVVIVLDPAFGDRILEVGNNDVWITPSEVNRDAANRLRKLVENESNAPLVSMWSAPRAGVTEDEWLAILQDIEVHHGEYAHDPVVTRLRIIGATPEPHSVAALREYGYTDIKSEVGGFTASRAAPPN